MLLGDLLNQFEDEGVAAETILRVGDLAMIAAMTRGAEAAGLTLGAYAAATGPALVSIPVHRLQISRVPVATKNSFAATVDHISYLGPFIQITVRIGDLVLESHQASTRETETLRAGDAVHASWDSADVVLIPAQRG